MKIKLPKSSKCYEIIREQLGKNNMNTKPISCGGGIEVYETKAGQKFVGIMVVDLLNYEITLSKTWAGK